MKHCPNPDCSHLADTGRAGEYRDEAVTCSDCRTDLAPGEPPEIEQPGQLRWTAVMEVPDPHAAHLARSALAMEGIPSELRRAAKDTDGLVPGTPAGAEVIVPDHLADAARKALEARSAEPVELPDDENLEFIDADGAQVELEPTDAEGAHTGFESTGTESSQSGFESTDADGAHTGFESTDTRGAYTGVDSTDAEGAHTGFEPTGPGRPSAHDRSVSSSASGRSAPRSESGRTVRERSAPSSADDRSAHARFASPAGSASSTHEFSSADAVAAAQSAMDSRLDAPGASESEWPPCPRCESSSITHAPPPSEAETRSFLKRLFSVKHRWICLACDHRW